MPEGIWHIKAIFLTIDVWEYIAYTTGIQHDRSGLVLEKIFCAEKSYGEYVLCKQFRGRM